MSAIFDESQQFRERRALGVAARLMQQLHIDGPLLLGLLALCSVGMFVLFSAGGQDQQLLVKQGVRLGVAFGAMLIMAQVPPSFLRDWSPWLYLGGAVLLVMVLVLGDVGGGAQRWLDLGVVRFQPSEIMKLAVPMMVAWHLHSRPLPPTFGNVIIALVISAIPAALIARQPDLGTALIIGASGLIVIYLSGLRVRLVLAAGVIAAALAPVLWHFMHDYQKQRVLTFLDPSRDPLGAGYHTIQAKIAIGSGGTFGKGWLNGSQATLDFLPEPDTDFIFAVLGEEFGLSGLILVLLIYLFIVGRGLFIAAQGQDSYSRLLAGCISLTFFVYVFVNTGMVTGLLPVVGVPLPLVSYGGTSMVTMMAGFGILMSVHTHRKLLSQ